MITFRVSVNKHSYKSKCTC